MGALLDTDRLDLSLGREGTAGDVSWGLEAAYTAQDKKYDSRRGDAISPIGGMSVTRSEYDATKFGLSLHAEAPVGSRHFLEMRADYSDESLGVKGDTVSQYLGGIGSYDMDGLDFTIQDTVSLDGAGTLLFTPSLRWHKVGGDDKFSWQLALSKEFSPALMIKSSYGTYSRAPNMYERYGDGAFILPSETGLDWETGEQFDAGAEWSGELKFLAGARARVSLSGFYRRTDDLIEFFMENPRYGRYFNVAESEVKGVETEASLDWKKWSLSLQATWMDAINKSPDEGSVRYFGLRLPNRPEFAASARVSRKFGRALVFAEYQYTGENYADSHETVLYDARNVANLGVKYDLSATTRLSLGVNDLFDDADGWRMRPDGLNGPTRILWYPVEGRSYYATLEMEL
jgi:outer membrane receptor protein involved in Fe transport